MKNEEKLKLIIYLIVFVVIIGPLIGLSVGVTNQIIQWLVSIFIGVLTSVVTGSLIEAFTGNVLKKILINIEITDDFSLSISIFTITTFFVKIWLFGF